VNFTKEKVENNSNVMKNIQNKDRNQQKDKQTSGKANRTPLLFFVFFLSLCLTSCEAIEGIFKTGVGVGMFIVISVIVVIVIVLLSFRKNK
jgi:hypothetical protein